MRVSAVVVTYNSAGCLPAVLPALADAVDELVVVDNASSDGSLALARRLAPDAVTVGLPENRGFAAGVNAGVRAASGTHLLLANPDTRLDAAAVAGLRAAAQRHPGDVVGPLVRFPDGRLQPSRSGPPTLWNLLGEQVLVPEGTPPGRWPARLWPRWADPGTEAPGPVLSGCALLVPRSALEAVGPFDEGYFLYWEEVDWQLRAQAAGIRSWYVPSVEVVHARMASSGDDPAGRAAVLATATRRFVRRWFRPPRRQVALGLLVVGQLVRWAVWSLPPWRHREPAAARRAQHALSARTLVGGGRR